MFSIIVAQDINDGIARQNTIPWHCKQDLAIFKYLTSEIGETTQFQNNAVVMGYNTWQSLPNKPLPKRKNIIISKSHVCECTGVEWYSSPEDFLLNVKKSVHYWIIGGAQIYKWFLDNNLIYDMFITKIADDFKCDLTIDFTKYSFKQQTYNDKFIDDILENCKKSADPVLSNIRLDYMVYKNKSEQQLLDTIKDILIYGSLRNDRTGTGTISGFAYTIPFDLVNFPLMTSRPHSLRWIFEELMWILRGQTDVNILENKGINIWTPNSTKEFINKQKLDINLAAGCIGESYGHNMRNYGADITKPESTGYDQLAYVIDLLKNNPTSRRIIINLWNVASVKRSALPPCLCLYQFYVRTTNTSLKYLDCLAYNRSSDIVVAGGWNVATAALLVYILAAACDYKPGKLMWMAGDTHIYNNNIDAAYKLIERTPKNYPKLFITKKISTLDDILNMEFSDLKLINYTPNKPQINLCMNA